MPPESRKTFGGHCIRRSGVPPDNTKSTSQPSSIGECYKDCESRRSGVPPDNTAGVRGILVCVCLLDVVGRGRPTSCVRAFPSDFGAVGNASIIQAGSLFNAGEYV